MQQTRKCLEFDAKMHVVTVWSVKWVTRKVVTRCRGLSQVCILQNCFFDRGFAGPQEGKKGIEVTAKFLCLEGRAFALCVLF